MGRGPALSELQKLRVVGFHSKGYSVSEIASKLNKSWICINNVVRPKRKYGRPRKIGRPRCTTLREDRCICRHASNRAISCKDIALQLPRKVSKRTVNRRIHECGYIKKVKMKTRPKLIARHIAARLAWARLQVNNRTDWDPIWFSDEKRFCLEGPDGYRYYWHDLRKESLFYQVEKHSNGITVWGAINSRTRSQLGVETKNINSLIYQDLLRKNLLPQIPNAGNSRIQFQRDNAPSHTSLSTRKFFIENSIDLFDFPPCSPDMNPMEHLWAVMVKRVYGYGQRYETIEGLRAAIERSWSEIPQRDIKNTIDSMRNRVASLLEAEGKVTSY